VRETGLRRDSTREGPADGTGSGRDKARGQVTVANLTPCPQLRAVLHQLLQREAAAALHRADPEAGAGRVPAGGHRLAEREGMGTRRGCGRDMGTSPGRA